MQFAFSGYSSKWLIKVLILVFFAYKKYSRRFMKFRLNHWWQMDNFFDVFHTFLGLDSVTYMAVKGTVTSLLVFIQNNLNCVPKTNKAFMGLVRNKGKWLMTIFILGWSNPLSHWTLMYTALIWLVRGTSSLITLNRTHKQKHLHKLNSLESTCMYKPCTDIFAVEIIKNICNHLYDNKYWHIVIYLFLILCLWGTFSVLQFSQMMKAKQYIICYNY